MSNPEQSEIHLLRVEMNSKFDTLTANLSKLTEVLIRKEERDKNLDEKVALMNHDVLDLDNRVKYLELQDASSKPMRDLGKHALWVLVGVVVVGIAVAIGVKQ